MTAVAVVAHHERQTAAALARQAVAWLTEQGHTGWVIPDDATHLGLAELVSEQPLDSVQKQRPCLGGEVLG